MNGCDELELLAFLNLLIDLFLSTFLVSNRLYCEIDFLLGFYDSAQKLKADLSEIQKNLSQSGMAWVCSQKGSITDLSRDSIWRLAQSAGLAGVSSCAIDKNWSALKLMFPKDKRK